MHKFHLLRIFSSIPLLRNNRRYSSTLKSKAFNLFFSNDQKCLHKTSFSLKIEGTRHYLTPWKQWFLLMLVEINIKWQVLDFNNVSLKKKDNSQDHKKWSYQSVFLSPSQYNFKLFLQVHNLKLINQLSMIGFSTFVRL